MRSHKTDFESVVDRLDSKETRYIDYLIPGMLAMGVMNSCLWGVGWNLTKNVRNTNESVIFSSILLFYQIDRNRGRIGNFTWFYPIHV